MLKTSKELLIAAQRAGYAVPQFNVYNLETIQAVLAAGEKHQSPLILAATPGTRRSAGDVFMHALVKAAAQSASIPIAYHLDHHTAIEDIVPSLELGARSVMLDGSMLPFEETVDLVSRAVERAHDYGASVEGELGKLVGREDGVEVKAGEDQLTDPDLARTFVERTKTDTLAVAIGTAHGLYDAEPSLDYERLKAIRERVKIPLVLHGASGLPADAIRRCIDYGIAKVNFATELKIPFAEALRDFFTDHPEENDPRKYFATAKAAMQRVAEEKIEICGSGGKAS